MKNRVASGIIFVLLGALISLGPKYLFKVCTPMNDQFMRCYWTGRAELGIGLLIAILGILIFLIPSARTRLGINLSLVFTGLLASSVPTVLIGVCEMPKMNCHAVAAPSLLVLGILTTVLSLVNVIYLLRTTASKVSSSEAK